MSVIPLTLGFGLVLVGVFLVLFLREQTRSRLGSPERDALLPLAEELPHVVPLRRSGAAPEVTCDKNRMSRSPVSIAHISSASDSPDMGGTPMPRLPAVASGTGVPPVGLSKCEETLG